MTRIWSSCIHRGDWLAWHMSFAYHPHDIQKFSWVHDASASSRRFLELSSGYTWDLYRFSIPSLWRPIKKHGMPSYPFFLKPRLDWRHITMKYTVLGVWKPSFSMGWSPAPQAHLFLPLHHHHVAHQSRTRALMDLKMRSQRMFEMWLPKDSCSVWNPYYHWDLLKFYFHLLISNDIVNCQHEAIMLDLSWPRHCCHSMSRWYWEVTCSNPARRGCCQQICPYGIQDLWHVDIRPWSKRVLGYTPNQNQATS